MPRSPVSTDRSSDLQPKSGLRSPERPNMRDWTPRPSRLGIAEMSIRAAGSGMSPAFPRCLPLGHLRRRQANVGRACHSALQSSSWCDRTRSSASRGALVLRCSSASSGSCRSGVSVCSCSPATTLDSRDESPQTICATEPSSGLLAPRRSPAPVHYPRDEGDQRARPGAVSRPRGYHPAGCPAPAIRTRRSICRGT
jgi:hypothetical protein